MRSSSFSIYFNCAATKIPEPPVEIIQSDHAGLPSLSGVPSGDVAPPIRNRHSAHTHPDSVPIKGASPKNPDTLQETRTNIVPFRPAATALSAPPKPDPNLAEEYRAWAEATAHSQNGDDRNMCSSISRYYPTSARIVEKQRDRARKEEEAIIIKGMSNDVARRLSEELIRKCAAAPQRTKEFEEEFFKGLLEEYKSLNHTHKLKKQLREFRDAVRAQRLRLAKKNGLGKIATWIDQLTV